MSNKKQTISIFVLFFPLYLVGSILITGNSDAPEGQTFSFSIGHTLISPANNVYTSVLFSQGGAGIVNNFSIARLDKRATAFLPLTPERVQVNGIPDQPNPLFDQGIITFGLLEITDGWFDRREFPVVVTQSQPSNLYLIDTQLNSNESPVVAVALNDAAGNVTAGIIGVTTNIASTVFAAVKPHNGLFGDENSGIALVVKGFMNLEINEQPTKVPAFRQVDASTGSTGGILKAAPLDSASSQVAITVPVAAMQNFVSFSWSPSLNRLFIGLQVTAQDGARGVVVGSLVEGVLTLQNIAPDSAFAPGDQTGIVGVSGQGLDISINFLKNLFTSTALQYLIVGGGNQAPGVPTQTVYALPLVTTGLSTGMIANTNAQPVDVFSMVAPKRLIARTITDAAQGPQDMPHSNDTAVMVGAGPFTAGTITDMIVRDDTVFIFVGSSTVPGAVGIYYSQALFEASGAIKGWTTWQRVAGIVGNSFLGALDSSDGSFIAALGANSQSINTVRKTVWSNGDPQGLQSITALVNAALAPSTGGVQSLYTFLPSTPGLDAVSMLAFGGGGTIVLVQTGTFDTVLISTPADEFPPTEPTPFFDNGTITRSPNATTVLITGGVLDDIGPITAVEVAQAGNNGWIFVGGINGVAVLANPDGSGWNVAAGQLGNNFNGLVAGMNFMEVGNYNFVKKLVCDDEFLYVISDTTVDRIDLAASNFSTNMLQLVTVATQQGLATVTPTGSIVDAVISDAFGLLATTGGLFRVGNNSAINTATNQQAVNWTFVPIPEAAGAPVQLAAVTQTGRAQDIVRKAGGHVYVLNSSNGFDQSHINRFAVSPLVGGLITSETLVVFDDLFVQNIPSFFLSFGQFKNIFTTDGALYFASRGAINNALATVTLTPSFPEPRVGVPLIGEKSVVQDVIFNNETELNAFDRSQGSGSWIVAGNFGMQVLE